MAQRRNANHHAGSALDTDLRKSLRPRQKRGFVGGNPLQDLVDAEQEIDDAYETDFESVFSLTSTAEITEQLRSLFACYGCDQAHLDSLLDGSQVKLERLAALNRQSLNNASGLAAQQSELLKGVASEAVNTLQAFTQGRLRSEGVLNVAELAMQTLDSTLAGFQQLTQSVTIISTRPTSEAPGQALLQDAIAMAYQGCSAKELTDAPVTALKGISTSLGRQLEEEFAISSVRDMADHPHTEWASGIVLLADTERLSTDRSSRDNSRDNDDQASARGEHRQELRSVADAPLAEVREISDRQATLLREAFGIVTARDFATNCHFNIARAIVMLAESES